MDVEKLLAQIEAAPAATSVRTVFGEPITVGERTIIPVARVGGAFGLGFGRGQAPVPEGAAGREGAGGGGGARFAARPIAVIEVTAERARVIPIVDWTRLALAGMLMIAWNVFWVMLTVRTIEARRAG
ncbi:MAG: hypothetical protein IRY83_16505 [Chloroflexi bacterium]|nr:hypothetical protein [Chloroflexota bacterium]